MCANRGRTKKGNISNEYSDGIRMVLHGDMVVCFIFFFQFLFIFLAALGLSCGMCDL